MRKPRPHQIFHAYAVCVEGHDSVCRWEDHKAKEAKFQYNIYTDIESAKAALKKAHNPTHYEIVRCEITLKEKIL